MISILGSNIKYLREENNLSQKELASILNIANSTLSQYESGDRVPSDDIKIKIANQFNVSLDYLLGRTSNPHKTLTPIEEEFEDPEIKILARKAKSLTPEQLKAVQAVIDSYERNKKNDEMD